MRFRFFFLVETCSFYFQWENHFKSLKLEEKMLEKIKKRIDEKVNNHEGTWIDWQYLYNAAALLTKVKRFIRFIEVILSHCRFQVDTNVCEH